MQLNGKKTVTFALILVLTVSLLLVSIQFTSATEESWTKKSPMQVARSYTGVAVVNGKIYVIGGDALYQIGWGEFHDALNITEEYNPETDTWVFKEPIPTPRYRFAVAVYQNKIYCIGGKTNDGVTGVNEVYDPATDTWETKTAMPTPRMGLQANIVDKKIYLISSNVNEVYDPTTDTWTTKTSPPNHITSGASAVADNKIYFLATLDCSLDLGAFIQIYDPKSDGWSVGGTAPTYGESAVTAAGTSGVDESKKIIFFQYSSTLIYYPANDSWALGTTIPNSRGYAGVALLNGVYSVVGGIKLPFEFVAATSSVVTNEQYTPNEHMPINADTKIYIRADGSIEPSTANITTTDNIVYTFTGNNSDRMIIERDNIIVDGNGYTLQGTSGPYEDIQMSYGIVLYQRHNVTIANLAVKQFSVAGIGIQSSTNNFIVGNSILSNMNNGIRFYSGASNNTVTGNNIKYNKYMAGIDFYNGSTNNVISSNNITGGIYSIEASGNIITGNNIKSSGCCVGFYSSSNNTITNNNLESGYRQCNLCLRGNSNYNIISGNNITNSEIGIVLENSTNNHIYHNNFVNNELHADDDSSNIWDNGYPSGGNYWSNYNGTDNNVDCIGDAPYLINENNTGIYPLMAPITIFDAGTWEWTSYNVNVISNSTVSDFNFNPEEGALIRFNVDGETGSTGFCRVEIPKDMLYAEGNWTVMVDGNSVTSKVNEDTNNTYLYFTYQHNSKTVEIHGTTAIPEFPSWTILPLLITATLVIIICKQKLPKTSN